MTTTVAEAHHRGFLEAAKSRLRVAMTPVRMNSIGESPALRLLQAEAVGRLRGVIDETLRYLDRPDEPFQEQRHLADQAEELIARLEAMLTPKEPRP